MPIVQISMLGGRSAEQVAELIAAVTDAVSRTIDAPAERVRVLVTEVPATHWGVGGTPLG